MAETMRVLIAEHDVTIREMLSAIVRKWDYQPVTAPDGSAALEIMLEADAPQLAIIDWEMPGLSGTELCRVLRKRETPVPPYILIFAPRNARENVVKGLESGANDYLPKPYDSAELRARLQVGRQIVDLQKELLQARNELEHEAVHDSLTGILNRKATLAALAREIARSKREKRPLSIGMLDIDHFKNINDTYGHQAGDQVLRGVVGTLSKTLREYDILGRMGGDEFLVIAPGTGTATGLYQRLRTLVESTKIAIRSGKISVTISIGAADAVVGAETDSVLAAADAALSVAKRTGRNCVTVAKNNL